MKKLVLVLWVGCAIPFFLSAQGMWTIYNTSNSGLPNNSVLSVAVGKNGDIWAGTAGGLAHFDGVNWTAYTTSNSGIPFGNIGAVAVNSSNVVYFIQPPDFNFTHLVSFDGVNWTNYYSNASNTLLREVDAIAFDGNDVLWGITQDRYSFNLFYFDGTGWGTYNYYQSSSTYSLGALSIDRFGNKWTAFGNVLYKFNGSTFTSYPYNNTSNEIQYIGNDMAGNAWASMNYSSLFGGSSPDGLYYFNGASWSQNYNSANSGLSNNEVNAIVTDLANVKWFGTSHGLSKFANNLWTSYDTTNSSIPGNHIYDVAIDANGSKWIGTDRGLAKFSDGGAGPMPFATTTISGTILNETGLAIPGVTITLSGNDSITVTTDTTGAYSFTVESGGNYTITPSKSNDSIPNNGVTLIDVLLMRRHILGMPLSSPYKIIAAAEVNADDDTTIITQDILFTRSLILGNISSFPTNRLWQFVSSDYVFPDTQHPFPFPSTRTYTNITTNQTNQNFIGIKLGDVNGSWDPNTP